MTEIGKHSKCLLLREMVPLSPVSPLAPGAPVGPAGPLGPVCPFSPGKPGKRKTILWRFFDILMYLFFMKTVIRLTQRAPPSRWPRRPSVSHRPHDSLHRWAAFTDVKETFVVFKGVVFKSIPRGCDSIHMEVGGISVDGVRSSVLGGEGVTIKHDLCRLFRVRAGKGRHGDGLYESSTTCSTTASASRGLLGGLGLGPTCGSAAGGENSHRCHKRRNQED